MSRHRRPLLGKFFPPPPTPSLLFCSDLNPCLAVGRTSPRMELDAHFRITEMFFRSPLSHDRRTHHGKVLVRKASSEVKERERERETERASERERESIVTPARSEVSTRKVERRPCQMFSFLGNWYSLGSLLRRPQYAKRRGVMSPDEASAQASKKGNGSDALCIMGRVADCSSRPEPPEIQLDASPAICAASSPTADTTASSTQSRSPGTIMCTKLHASEARSIEEHTHSSPVLFPNSWR